VVEAYEVLMKTSVDVLFLDINMPVVSGLDFYRSLKDPPLLVFTTAYPEYAVEGFELEAVDYLVKPVTFDRFLKTAERLHERLSIQSERRQTGTTPSGDYIFIKHAGKLSRSGLTRFFTWKHKRTLFILLLPRQKYWPV
jgi:two-component SAPR family response regulator